MVTTCLSLQLLVASASVHRIPHYTAVLLLALLGTALLTGLSLGEPRSFCKILCPASALLSVYGRQAPAPLDIVDSGVCSSCTTRDCVAEANRLKLDARSCPSLNRLLPAREIGWMRAVRPVREGVPRTERRLRADLLGTIRHACPRCCGPSRRRSSHRHGFVTHEVVGNVKWLDEMFHVIPAWLGSFAPGIGFGWVEALWFLVLVPARLWTVVVGLSYALGHRGAVRDLLLRDNGRCSRDRGRAPRQGSDQDHRVGRIPSDRSAVSGGAGRSGAYARWCPEP